MKSEKGEYERVFLPTIVDATPRKPVQTRLLRLAALATSVVATLVGLEVLLKFHGKICGGSVSGLEDVLDVAMDYTPLAIFEQKEPTLCPQVEQILPEKHRELWDDVGDLFSLDSFKLKAAEWLGGAVRIPCV